MRLVGHVARMGATNGVCMVLVANSEVKIPLQELKREGLCWIDRAEGRDRWHAVVNAVMNVWVPSNAVYFFNS